jgi:hypothetical protein
MPLFLGEFLHEKMEKIDATGDSQTIHLQQPLARHDTERAHPEGGG